MRYSSNSDTLQCVTLRLDGARGGFVTLRLLLALSDACCTSVGRGVGVSVGSQNLQKTKKIRINNVIQS